MPRTARLSENIVPVHHFLHTMFESQTARRLELARDTIILIKGLVLLNNYEYREQGLNLQVPHLYQRQLRRSRS
jgi:hypothetical protein